MDLIDWLHRVLGIREAFLCFASYHSDNVETIIADDGLPSENLASRAFFCFSFMCLAVPPFGERFPGTAKSQKGQRSPKGF